MSCEHDCTRPAAFPRTIANRPGLDRVDYRIGDYAAMREHMLALIDASPALAGWTHRRADDPAIAFVEAAAMVGDVLAAYQDAYANEAWLRTATQRDGVGELVRLLGYRLAPGLGGRARFAVAVKGPRPVTIPAGFAITVKLPGDPKPAVFETTTASTAWPALSQFHLYRPRTVPAIANGADTFQLDAGNDIRLAAGDRLLVGVADGRTLTHTQIVVVDAVVESFGVRLVTTRGRITALAGASSLRRRATLSLPSIGGIGAIARVTGMASTLSSTLSSTTAATWPAWPASASLGSVAAAMPSAGAIPLLPVRLPAATLAGVSGIGLAGAGAGASMQRAGYSLLPAYAGVLVAGIGIAALSSVASLRAFKLGASSRHFGHSAPAVRIAVHPTSGLVTEVPVPYLRRLDANQGDPAAPQLRPRQLPLDGELADFAAGTTVLVEANLSADAGGASPRKRVLERLLTQVDRQSLGWGPATGASTVLELDDDLAIVDDGSTLRHTDIRGVTVHAVQGQGFRLRAAAAPTPVRSGSALDYFGGADDAAALAGRTVLAMTAAGPLPLHVLAVQVDRSGGVVAGPRWHRVTVDRDVAYADFAHDAPTVTLHGNLVDATQGRTEAEVPIGDGDARRVFQTMALPKSPLTFLLDTAVSPPQVPELQVRVAGVLWRRVDSLVGSGPRETVYVVRETDDGSSAVQFGDGITGARLPSGVGNVSAVWRTGSGARGSPEGDDKPSAAKRLPGFDAVTMPEPATGGAAPESAANARRAAPATMQSLGRIVSLADVEAEAITLPGVLKARAAWQLVDAAPVVVLTVLVASGDAADAAAVERALRLALSARGPARWPLVVRSGQRLRIAVALTIAADPALRPADIADAVAVALGVEDDDPGDDLDRGERGLMHWRRRGFGEGLHGSQVIAAAQSVAGVRWVQLDRLEPAPVQSAAVATATATATGTATAPARRLLRATPSQLLSLQRSALGMRFVADAVATTGSAR